MAYLILITLILSGGAFGLAGYTFLNSRQSRLLAIKAHTLATSAHLFATNIHTLAMDAHALANTKLSARMVIADSGQQICSKCNLRVHRYEVDTAGAVICMNCLTENK